MRGTVCFDIETHDADLLYSMSPEEFVRLIGYQWVGDNEVVITTDLEELRAQIRQARTIVGHNIHDFDLRAVFGVDSDEPMELADQGRVYDTFTHAVLVHPAPEFYVNKDGKSALAKTPEQARKWFSLDEQAHQLGVPGKTADLQELALEFGDPSIPKKKDRISDGFGKIPTYDARYRDYLRGDVLASKAVAKALLGKGGLDDYALREQCIASRAAVISSNGLRVDQDAAQARAEDLADRRDAILEDLVDYGLPTEGKAPWATDAGKDAIFKALADYGITPDTCEWTRTANGNFSLSGDVLVSLTEGTEAEELGKALAELKGQRSLAQLALDSVYPDGFVHPGITMLQRSGRTSTTKPGLTVWTARGDGAIEKAYFIPDNRGEVLLGLDYSNADARVVAALSGDRKYAQRFEPGADGHMINAVAAWGQEVVDTDRAGYRQRAKILGHGWSYGGQANTLAKQTGVPLENAKEFCAGMEKAYPVLMNWQNRVRRQVKDGRIYNAWGRPMYVEPGREFTQVPALHGQSGTREIMFDAILRMPYHIVRRIKALVHDEILFSVPRRNWQECRDYLIWIMQTKFSPKGGQTIEFPVEAGPAGNNWFEAGHA